MHQLSVEEVVRHLTTKDGNNFLADDQYVTADEERREQIRAGVADVVTSLLVQGLDGDFAEGSVAAEHICNAMSHLAVMAAQEDELNRPAMPEGRDA